MKISFAIIISVIIFLFLGGCVSKKGTIKTYLNPSVNASEIKSVAIFPLRNSFVQASIGLETGEMIDINKMFQVEFHNRNGQTKLVDAVSSKELLNQAKLVNSYDTLLAVLENTGIPNTEILNKIGNKLGVDAIIQGFVKEVFQRDGVYGGNRGETRIIIKYIMLSTSSGDVLWEARCEGYKGTATTLAKAPPIEDAIEIIKGKIVSAMPVLSQG
jgi:hypothetical protein